MPSSGIPSIWKMLQMATNLVGSWSNWFVKEGWKSCTCSPWRRDSFGGDLGVPCPSRGLIKKDPGSCMAWQEDQLQKLTILIKSLRPDAQNKSGSGTGFSERLRSLYPFRFSRSSWINPWATWSELAGDPPIILASLLPFVRYPHYTWQQKRRRRILAEIFGQRCNTTWRENIQCTWMRSHVWKHDGHDYT